MIRKRVRGNESGLDERWRSVQVIPIRQFFQPMTVKYIFLFHNKLKYTFIRPIMGKFGHCSSKMVFYLEQGWLYSLTAAGRKDLQYRSFTHLG